MRKIKSGNVIVKCYDDDYYFFKKQVKKVNKKINDIINFMEFSDTLKNISVFVCRNKHEFIKKNKKKTTRI